MFPDILHAPQLQENRKEHRTVKISKYEFLKKLISYTHSTYVDVLKWTLKMFTVVSGHIISHLTCPLMHLLIDLY